MKSYSILYTAADIADFSALNAEIEINAIKE